MQPLSQSLQPAVHSAQTAASETTQHRQIAFGKSHDGVTLRFSGAAPATSPTKSGPIPPEHEESIQSQGRKWAHRARMAFHGMWISSLCFAALVILPPVAFPLLPVVLAAAAAYLYLDQKVPVQAKECAPRIEVITQRFGRFIEDKGELDRLKSQMTQAVEAIDNPKFHENRYERYQDLKIKHLLADYLNFWNQVSFLIDGRLDKEKGLAKSTITLHDFERDLISSRRAFPFELKRMSDHIQGNLSALSAEEQKALKKDGLETELSLATVYQISKLAISDLEKRLQEHLELASKIKP